MLLYLLSRHSSVQVHLISYKEDKRFLAALLLYILDPLLQCVERINRRDIIHYNRSRSVPYVARDQGTEPLLSGSVPKLHANCSIVVIHRFWEEIDTYSRLVSGIERWIHKLVDDWCLPDAQVAEKHDFVLVHVHFLTSKCRLPEEIKSTIITLCEACLPSCALDLSLEFIHELSKFHYLPLLGR
jgi:hypothetical protein